MPYFPPHMQILLVSVPPYFLYALCASKNTLEKRILFLCIHELKSGSMIDVLFFFFNGLDNFQTITLGLKSLETKILCKR